MKRTHNDVGEVHQAKKSAKSGDGSKVESRDYFRRRNCFSILNE
uniref:Uncharacterized protein n=1 Tax=Lepeophtheirus salmonis TaxID=72036 RepID=A0A0K2U4Q1_LEPSM